MDIKDLEATLKRRIITAAMAYKDNYNRQMSPMFGQSGVKPLGDEFVQATVDRMFSPVTRVDDQYPHVDIESELQTRLADEASARDRVLSI